MPDRPSRSEEAGVAYANLIAFSRANTAWCRRGSFEDRSGVLAYAGGSWIPVNCNGAFRTDESIAATDLIDRADAFFAHRKRGYTIKIRDTGQDADVAAACGATGPAAYGEPFPEMICRAPFGDVTPPEGVELHLVTDEQGLLDFVAVNADAYATYGMPPEAFTDSFDRPAIMLADDHVGIVVAYQGTRPVATALTYLSGDSASLQWVGTVGDARQVGLGRVVTQRATNLAFERGADSCTLQASVMGEPVYTKLGYETLYRYQNHVRWQPPPD